MPSILYYWFNLFPETSHNLFKNPCRATQFFCFNGKLEWAFTCSVQTRHSARKSITKFALLLLADGETIIDRFIRKAEPDFAMATQVIKALRWSNFAFNCSTIAENESVEMSIGRVVAVQLCDCEQRWLSQRSSVRWTEHQLSFESPLLICMTRFAGTLWCPLDRDRILSFRSSLTQRFPEELLVSTCRRGNGPRCHLIKTLMSGTTFLTLNHQMSFFPGFPSKLTSCRRNSTHSNCLHLNEI